LQGIASKASREQQHRFTGLYRRLDEPWLGDCWRKLNKRSASGVDRVTPRPYGEERTEKLPDLVARLREGRYRAPWVRRKQIAGGAGKTRPLGIPTVEDKLVQAGVACMLEAIWKADFLPCSFGYRPGIAIDDEVQQLDRAIMFGSYRYVVEADIEGFFNQIEHDWMRRMLEDWKVRSVHRL
jgi:retron-type reverse transcriptase